MSNAANKEATEPMVPIGYVEISTRRVSIAVLLFVMMSMQVMIHDTIVYSLYRRSQIKIVKSPPILQLYRSVQIYCWRKPEYLDKTTKSMKNFIT
jgi:hypothetical protein